MDSLIKVMKKLSENMKNTRKKTIHLKRDKYYNYTFVPFQKVNTPFRGRSQELEEAFGYGQNKTHRCPHTCGRADGKSI